MKTASLVIVFASCFATAQIPSGYQRRGLSMNEDPVKPGIRIINYPMRNIPQEDPRFAKVLARVSDEDQKKQNEDRPLPTSFEILQTVHPGKFLALRHRTQNQILILSPGSEWADGEKASSYLRETEELFSYTSVLGAPSKVKIFAAIPAPENSPRLSAADFIIRLKSGASFLIEDGSAMVTCNGCSGAGRIPIRTGTERSGDGKKECDACKGVGKISVIQQIKVMW